MSYIATTTLGRIRSVILVGFTAEWWSVSNRNRGRFHAGMVVGFIRNLHLDPGIDYTYEIEAFKIGRPFHRSYLKAYYPKTYYAYFANWENQCSP